MLMLIVDFCLLLFENICALAWEKKSDFILAIVLSKNKGITPIHQFNCEKFHQMMGYNVCQNENRNFVSDALETET